MTKFSDAILGADAWRFPGAATRGLIFGALIGMFGWGAVAGYMHTRLPVFRPVLQLVETRVEQGGELLFWQNVTIPTRACPEETRRTVFRLMDPKNPYGPRRTEDLNDWSSLWPGSPAGSIISVPLPSHIAPGEWFYQRITWMWCTPWNWIAGPDLIITPPLRFEVVAR